MQPEQRPEAIPVAVKQLEDISRRILQISDEMTDLRAIIEKNRERNKKKAALALSQLQKQFAELKAQVGESKPYLLEAEQPQLAEYSVKLSGALEKFNLMTPDYSKIAAILADFANKLKLHVTTNAAVIARLMNSVKMGYYPTDLDNVALIKRAVKFPENITANLFDPCCGCGLALAKLGSGNFCKTYGIELDEARGQQARGHLGRVGLGSFFKSTVSREAFHLMLLNPPYISVTTRESSHSRHEKNFLVGSLSSLMIGGVMIYIIPYYRMTADICRILADNFKDIALYRFTDNEFKKFRQIAVFGVRQKQIDGSALAKELSGKAEKPENLPSLTEIASESYALPMKTTEVGVFKGQIFNVEELAEQLERSNKFKEMLDFSKLESKNRRPLLPLTTGQIGLIGGSGLINGLIDCEYPHVIKGRMIKQKNVRENPNYNRAGTRIGTTIHEVFTNKMVFNVLTPDGIVSIN